MPAGRANGVHVHSVAPGVWLALGRTDAAENAAANATGNTQATAYGETSVNTAGIGGGGSTAGRPGAAATAAEVGRAGPGGPGGAGSPGGPVLPRAVQTLGARGVLRALLATVLPEAVGVPVDRAPSGAPLLRGLPGVRVSLSHDGPWAAAAVARGLLVGIDVQVPVAGSGRRLVRRCAPRHAAALERLPDARLDEEIAWVWSVQEACVKAYGRGLSARPWRLDVPPFAAAGRIGGLGWRSFRGRFGVPLSCAYAAPGTALPGPAV
jgi:4'-phosphopantetheinyl transferase